MLPAARSRTSDVGDEDSVGGGGGPSDLASSEIIMAEQHSQERASNGGEAFGIEDVKRTLLARGGISARVAAPASSSGLTLKNDILPASKEGGQLGRMSPPGPSRKPESLAQQLLHLCRCFRCEQIMQDPVTLPCGHSTCLTCIVASTSSLSIAATPIALPCKTHLPPRLPLASTTVPCTATQCPRSAIGRGMGVWAGHRAIYGGSIDEDAIDGIVSSTGEDDSGAAPFDGFVAPHNQEGNRLVVIPAQDRHSFREKFALSKYDLQSTPLAQERGLLRPDVTLTKAIELLRRYNPTLARSPTTSGRYSSRLSMRGELSSRQRRTRNWRGPRQQSWRISGSNVSPSSIDDTRTVIHPAFLPALGVSERGRDTGAEGGIRATWDTDDDDSMDEDNEGERIQSWGDEEEDREDAFMPVEDDEDEEIGGAFARRYTSSSRTSDNMSQKARSFMSSAPVAASSLRLESLHSDLLDVLECQLCYMLLYQPLTTPCGHTFCRQCFARSLDHSSSCPLCRAEMPSFAFFQQHPSNKIILGLLTAEWEQDEEGTMTLSRPSSLQGTELKAIRPALGLKQLYEERQMIMEKEARESLLSTPLFVCTLAFPQMPTILHIFEPRYRLMIRRCLESGHARFGMVLPSQETTGPVAGMSRYGTMLEIKTVQMLPDGRSMIETVGSHRFRVLEKGSLDGYTVGQIEPLDDVEAEAEDDLEKASLGLLDPSAPLSVLAEAREAKAAFLAAIGINVSRGEEQDRQIEPAVLESFAQRNTEQLAEVCLSFIETLRSGSAPWLMTRLNHTYGPMPETTDVAAFGYWMALVMPIDEHEKAKLLPIRSPRLRLRIVVHWIEQLRQTWWFNHGCSVQ